MDRLNRAGATRSGLAGSIFSLVRIRSSRLSTATFVLRFAAMVPVGQAATHPPQAMQRPRSSDTFEPDSAGDTSIASAGQAATQAEQPDSAAHFSAVRVGSPRLYSGRSGYISRCVA